MGMQNTRGFRALKVWLNLRQAGRNGYVKMIADDITLATHLFELAQQHEELDAISCNLSITNFRYIPADLAAAETNDEYLNRLNRILVRRLQDSGEVFVSNAIIAGRYTLRACVVNFRTTRHDIDAIPAIVVRHGRVEHARLQRAAPSSGT